MEVNIADVELDECDMALTDAERRLDEERYSSNYCSDRLFVDRSSLQSANHTTRLASSLTSLFLSLY